MFSVSVRKRVIAECCQSLAEVISLLGMELVICLGRFMETQVKKLSLGVKALFEKKMNVLLKQQVLWLKFSLSRAGQWSSSVSQVRNVSYELKYRQNK